MYVKKRMIVLVTMILILFMFVTIGCRQEIGETSTSDNTGITEDNSQGKEETSDADMVGNMYKEGLPIVEEKVTYNFVASKDIRQQDFEDMDFFKRLEEKTNVHIEWELINGNDWAEKKNLILASGEWPDAFFAGIENNDVAQYAGQNVFVPLNDMIDKYAPNIKRAFEEKTLYRRLCTFEDGNIYSLGNANEDATQYNPDQLFIYKPWLDKLGLSMPETLDDFYNTLKAFKEQDPNGNGEADEIPFSFRAQNRIQGLGSLFGAFGRVEPTNHFVVEDGKVVFTADKPEYKEAISYFNNYFEEGLFDQEGFTQDGAQYFAKGKTEEVTLGSFMLWNAENMAGPERAQDYVPVPPLKGPDGHQLWTKCNLYNATITGATFVVTTGCENPEIVIRWVDQLYDKKTSAEGNWGAIGIVLREDSDGVLRFNDPPEGMSFDEFRYANSPVRPPSALFAEDLDKIIETPPMSLSKLEIMRNVYEPYMLCETLPGMPYNKEESDWLASTGTDINNLVNDNQAKWLLNSGIEEEWDNYISQLEKLNLEEHVKIMQNAYDRFMQ